ncbi:hypothetical protein A3F27_03395 [Candidatus Kaiserbacteria bacterium RIFCSPHIGHO2_12_FULL_53_13]|uniref:Uncharacterized protein n=1 Tax=Candidatus Kaiserbacteria bacterium RIFCSPHIGHO2_12_FULL_53_13 TaxID=1798502 RepID=A0A1F6E5Z5_9BACT|nr:MAG: hypothetical protein A3F27_03395 [Candidatus Kaiserbacteria bacterium RIFCSPHIGHO2_12_FULL_53_13]OGG74382.1 MAG: hypothetical protein A3A37_00240 [Candidatus Kaiserbacteria bacterium RIFCSPLOWO2_01_FULL_52_36]
MDAQDEELELQYATARVADEEVLRYIEIKEEARKLYGSFKPVKCPALGNQQVSFPSEGFNHLIYRIPKQERHPRVQIMRFELLTKARQLLERTNTVQEYEDYLDQVIGWKYKKKQLINTKIRDWGFVAIINGYRIKVVVRQVGAGEKQFLSVIPAWSTKYYRDIKIVRNTKGNVAD